MAGATTVRNYLAEAIQAAAPNGWKIKSYPAEPVNVTRETAMVSIWRTSIQPTGSDLTLAHHVTINIYGAKTADEAHELELEGNHDVVLVALQRLTSFSWEKSERMVWRDGTVSGWQITGTVSTSNVYREAINAE